jgi:peroxiredoxin Q/BCP
MGTNPKLSEGDAVPSFELQSDTEGTISAESLQGDKYVLYFYPKDDTPGCTTEACDFRDNLARLGGLGYKVFGVSPDTVESHEKFRGKYDLTFPLLADPEHEAAEAFGVWREKTNYGRKYTGIVRSTFVVDEEGKIAQIHDNVRAKGHVDRLLRDLSE